MCARAPPRSGGLSLKIFYNHAQHYLMKKKLPLNFFYTYIQHPSVKKKIIVENFLQQRTGCLTQGKL